MKTNVARQEARAASQSQKERVGLTVIVELEDAEP